MPDEPSEELIHHIEALMRDMPADKFEEMCALLGVDPTPFKEFLKEEIKGRTN